MCYTNKLALPCLALLYTLPYSTLLYSTLLYSTLLYSTLLSTLHSPLSTPLSTPLHSTPHHITPHHTLHYTTPHSTLHYTTLHYTTLHYTTLHYTTLHYTTLHYSTLLYSPPHPTPLINNLNNRVRLSIVKTNCRMECLPLFHSLSLSKQEPCVSSYIFMFSKHRVLFANLPNSDRQCLSDSWVFYIKHTCS